MPSKTLVDATDLETWANRRDAQSIVPQVVRRLIHATNDRVLHSGFRAGEGVQLGGWDGIVAVETGNAFVPEGLSAWELGTGKDIDAKASDDYMKRTKDPRGVAIQQATFVFLTPRRWSKKSEWVAAREREKKWRAVRAYDADDLEEWLEMAPAVHIWLSLVLGKRPAGIIDFENFWEDWSSVTQPPTTRDFVLSGRRDAATQIHAWLRDPARPLAIRAESRDEALAVLAASVLGDPAEDNVGYLSRAVVVRESAAWYQIATLGTPLILIQMFDDRDAVVHATRRGHAVVVPLGRADSASSNTMEIARLSYEEAVESLKTSGLPDEKATELATLAQRSLTTFRRKLAQRPEVQQPLWARPSEARPLVPLLLAGAWSEAKEGDRDALSTLARVPYDQVAQVAVRWSNEDDPPLRRVGDAWYMVSREDAWLTLARYLTRGDMEHLEEVVLGVLGSYDPRFDVPDEQRWMAATLGKTSRHSEMLYEHLAEMLAVMGARGQREMIASGIAASEFATGIVRRLLERAKTDWRVWASLSQWGTLSLLAEAAPDTFLEAVEEDLEGDRPLLLELFREQGSPLFSSSPHTGLLWALETLAWNPSYLTRAALVLARLARLDPGGTISNRPKNSLRGILLPWHPQTTATLDQRLRVIDTIRQHESVVTWDLLCELLPEHHGTAFNNPTPRWREWTLDRPRITRGDLVRAADEIVARMVEDADEIGSRWGNLIAAVGALPRGAHDVVLERLAGLDSDKLQPVDRAAVWDALRVKIARHRSFPDADWALPREQVDRLESLLQKFEPREAAARFGWLFSSGPALPEGRENDWKAQDEAVAERRMEAVRSIHAESGLQGILELVNHVEIPGALGFTLGDTKLTDGDDALLEQHLAAETTRYAQFARGFVAGRIRRIGREWGEAKLTDASRLWSSQQRAEILICLPCDRGTWELAASDKESDRQYWRLLNPFAIPNDEVEFAARKLLEHGRPYTAAELLAMNKMRGTKIPPVLIAEALELALRTSPEKDQSSNLFSHNLPELLDVLNESEEVEENRVAAIEWGFLPILGRSERAPKLLHRQLASDASFFTQVVALVYRAKGEEPKEATREEQVRARYGHELLDSWRTVPGTQEDGTIDENVLTDWVQRARAELASMGRQAIGDQLIGAVLSASPKGDSDVWPHPAVCSIFERIASRHLERGFEIGLFNSRGVYSRGLHDGGRQEVELATKYDEDATAIEGQWPRTAAILRRMAEQYRSHGRREDQETELREDMGG